MNYDDYAYGELFRALNEDTNYTETDLQKDISELKTVWSPEEISEINPLFTDFVSGRNLPQIA